MGLEEVFKLLSKGVLVSINSQKYIDEANFLMIEENFEELGQLVRKIGFELVGENGYFYMAKREKMNDAELQAFFNNHKNMILCIAILKQLFPYVQRGTLLKQSDFIVQLKQKEDGLLEQKFAYLFKTTDPMEGVERFFELLEKGHILEKRDSDTKDTYVVLSALEYYIKIVQSVVL
ncbi:MAG: hypothetical protein KU37_02410 [Sulfuricurvum sp. PC08-66]|nr:MAG: hypothetical protein KU37_02410 [Sulfuricurvum sp. PC08-66]